MWVIVASVYGIQWLMWENDILRGWISGKMFYLDQGFHRGYLKIKIKHTSSKWFEKINKKNNFNSFLIPYTEIFLEENNQKLIQKWKLGTLFKWIF